ncbi:Oidioi.mRNA.OKI2018_I69.XSR.g14549.t1.cds [Oikopleura dioica]|uniref:Oidioi.mRNA.OKI2018_I69.XSR.g14549.t1.cds n=1 Tax=Oikopleura dioica TaxID=34765 RepID=A0ABN7SE54_OIKDI|nr:Oidioi.mRNA.OKI2018_I69.XSR.g14549.t1.cds [Oikopleura dioica]
MKRIRFYKAYIFIGFILAIVTVFFTTLSWADGDIQISNHTIDVCAVEDETTKSLSLSEIIYKKYFKPRYAQFHNGTLIYLQQEELCNLIIQYVCQEYYNITCNGKLPQTKI